MPTSKRDQLGVVDEDAVAAVGEVERHVLVRLLARRAAVGVPDVDRLAVLDERAEALAEPVHVLADGEGQLLVHVTMPVRIGDHTDAPRRRARQHGTVGPDEVAAPIPLTAHPSGQVAGAEGGRTNRRRRDIGAYVCQLECVGRSSVEYAGEVLDGDSDDIRRGRAERDGDDRPVQGVSPRRDLGRRAVHDQLSSRGDDAFDVARAKARVAGPHHPVAVGESQCRVSCVCSCRRLCRTGPGARCRRGRQDAGVLRREAHRLGNTIRGQTEEVAIRARRGRGPLPAIPGSASARPRALFERVVGHQQPAHRARGRVRTLSGSGQLTRAVNAHPAPRWPRR